MKTIKIKLILRSCLAVMMLSMVACGSSGDTAKDFEVKFDLSDAIELVISVSPFQADAVDSSSKIAIINLRKRVASGSLEPAVFLEGKGTKEQEESPIFVKHVEVSPLNQIFIHVDSVLLGGEVCGLVIIEEDGSATCANDKASIEITSFDESGNAYFSSQGALGRVIKKRNIDGSVVTHLNPSELGLGQLGAGEFSYTVTSDGDVIFLTDGDKQRVSTFSASSELTTLIGDVAALLESEGCQTSSTEQLHILDNDGISLVAFDCLFFNEDVMGGESFALIPGVPGIPAQGANVGDLFAIFNGSLEGVNGAQINQIKPLISGISLPPLNSEAGYTATAINGVVYLQGFDSGLNKSVLLRMPLSIGGEVENLLGDIVIRGMSGVQADSDNNVYFSADSSDPLNDALYKYNSLTETLEELETLPGGLGLKNIVFLP